jgi:hypothetical protein
MYKRCQSYAPATFIPHDMHLVPILLMAESTFWPDRLSQRTIPMTTLEIQTANFRLVAHSLDHYYHKQINAYLQR